MEVEVGSSAGTAVTAAGGCTFSRKLLVADIAKDAETIGVDVDNFGCRLDRRSVDFHSHAEHACKGAQNATTNLTTLSTLAKHLQVTDDNLLNVSCCDYWTHLANSAPTLCRQGAGGEREKCKP